MKLPSWMLRLWNAVVGWFAPTPAHAPQKRRRKPRTPVVTKGTIGELLDSLDVTFKQIAQADDRASWTDKSLRDGLRAMGPLVPLYGLARAISWDRVEATVFPSLIFSAVAREDQPGDTAYPQFLYAHKVRKFAGGSAEPFAGERYEGGVCFTLEYKNERLFWANFGVTIDRESGRIGIVKQRQAIYHRLPRGGYHRVEWAAAAGLVSDEALQTWTAFAFNTWAARENNWRVSVRKGGRRATFCIPDNEAKRFFGDRDREATGKDGRLRPIIHFVRSHARVTAHGETTVKEHIRGLREFNWNGYHCAVLAPRFHLVDADAMQVASHDEVDLAGKWGMAPDKLGEFLADSEDAQALARPRYTYIQPGPRELPPHG